ESFKNAYEKDNQQVKEMMEMLIQPIKDEYKSLMARFLQLNGDGMPPENDAAFVASVSALHKRTAHIKKKITEFDVEQLDISQVGKDKPAGFFDNIKFLSVLDIVKLWKDAQEDILDIYKRRQDRRLKAAGAGITDALGLGKDIPVFGEYFAALRGYHERRYSGTDSEAAQKWQDSMKL